MLKNDYYLNLPPSFHKETKYFNIEKLGRTAL